MLAPDHRSVLRDLLRPPLGHELDAAVATTFTVDLGMVLLAALDLSRVRSDAQDRVGVMAALAGCADRIDVFHQQGLLRAPRRELDLATFVEPMLHETRARRSGYLFHPKVWFLRYADGHGDRRFRLICSTRNLTGDRGWDAVLRLDGYQEGARPDARNRPLADLLRTLPDLAVAGVSDERRHRIEKLAEDSRRVTWDCPDGTTLEAFHALGLGSRRTVLALPGTRHLVVAPFCSDEGLARLLPEGRGTVVSRAEDLDRLSRQTTAHLETYVIDAAADLADEPDDPDEPRPAGADDAGSQTSPPGPRDAGQADTGLHAKVFVAEAGSAAHVFVGSANATGPAFDGNVEFLVELRGRTAVWGIAEALRGGAGFGSLLQPYTPDPDRADPSRDEERRLLDRALRHLAAVPFTVTVAPAATDEGPVGQYRVRIATDEPVPELPDVLARCSLSTRPGHEVTLDPGTPVAFDQPDVPLRDVTPFVQLRLLGPSGLEVAGLVRARLVGEPGGRREAVLAGLLDTREKFLRFLALMLGEDDPLAQAITDDPAATMSGLDGGAGARTVALLERVMLALAHRPDQLDELDTAITALRAATDRPDVVPAALLDLWPTVMEARARLAGSAERQQPIGTAR